MPEAHDMLPRKPFLSIKFTDKIDRVKRCSKIVVVESVLYL